MPHFSFANKYPLLSCFICGSLSSFALPPASFWLAGLLLAPCLIMIASAISARQAALRAFMTSWGWCATSLYWIGHSLFVEGGAQLLLLPVVVLGLPAFLALFWAVFSLFLFRFSSEKHIRVMWLALGLGLADIARSILFTGFPWNVTGHIFASNIFASQAIFFVGQHSLNICGMGIIAAAALAVCRKFMLAAVLALPVLILLGVSVDRFTSRPEPRLILSHPDDIAPADIRIIQPAVPQAEKWQRAKQPEHLAKIAELTLSKLPVPPLVILPESAFANYWPSDEALVRDFTQQITPYDGQLLSGILRAEPLPSERKTKLYNSAILLSRQNTQPVFYDKKHLVPFGEYVPFRFIPFIDAIAGPVDFTAGNEVQEPVKLANGHQLALLICYEVIFPGFLNKNPSHKAADVIVNLTNDGWFGRTAGPHQHLSQARLRAIEEAKPLIRVANTGISAGYDAFGVEVGRLGLKQADILDFRFAPIAPEVMRWKGIDITAYRPMMVWIFGGLWAVLCLMLEFIYQKRHNRNQR